MPNESLPESAALIRELVLPMLDRELVPIVQLGHPALRRVALPFDGQLADGELAALISLMRRVMNAAPGVGLAAPQIGIPLQIAVLEDPFEGDPEVAADRERAPLSFFAALNPRYTPIGDRTATFFEGCLSFEGYSGAVERARSVTLEYLDAGGAPRSRELHGWQARIAQHETDHLNGTVYVDKAFTRSLCSNEEYGRRWASTGIDEARRVLGF